MRSPPGLRLLAVSVLMIAAAYASAFFGGGRLGPTLLATGTAGSIAATMVLGVSRRGTTPVSLRLVFLATFLLVAGGFGLALYLPAEGVGATLWLGLPRRAAILVYGIGLAPVLLLPVAYAATFDRATLSEDDLARFRSRLAELRAGAPADAAGEGARSDAVAAARRSGDTPRGDHDAGGPGAAGSSGSRT